MSTPKLHRQRIQHRPGYRVLVAIPVVCVCAIVAGCAAPQKTFSVERPVQHTVSTPHFVIQSNFRIPKDAPLVRELDRLRQQITETLALPRQRDPVVVYLFSDEETYRRYMHATWPNLPPRRAYFVGTSRELSIYSFHSERVREDLRHEFTHGLLHASLDSVPLWLDEGLAEYFEVGGPDVGTPHKVHVQYLQSARAEGWNPSLYQLEQLSDFRKMTQRDYAESWGWVHFMLHNTDATRATLIDYVAELESKSVAAALKPRLEKAAPAYYNGMISHVTNMAQGIALASHRR